MAGDKGVAALANMLRVNKTLEVLYICNEGFVIYKKNLLVTREELPLLVLKKYNSLLRELHVCGNTSITNKGFRKLTKTVQKNKTLTFFIDLPEQISKTLDKETMKRVKPGSKELGRQGKITATISTSVVLAGILRAFA